LFKNKKPHKKLSFQNSPRRGGGRSKAHSDPHKNPHPRSFLPAPRAA
jgi:hypothetical protein